MNAELLFEANAQLGEGAIWAQESNEFYWVDIEGMTLNIFNYSTQQNSSYYIGKKIGSVVPVDNDKLLLALIDGIAIFNRASESVDYQINTDFHHDYSRRFNDGKCDPYGRFWAGTHSMAGIRNVNSLYCIHPGFTIEEKVTEVSISNGIAWSIDYKKMYYIDTPTGNIDQFDYDYATSHITNRKAIISIPTEMGYPDGMTIDSEGMLWIALWDGFAVARYSPETGELLQKIVLPVPKVTSCAFGGPDLETLFITTASVEMTENELEQYPMSGSIFCAKPGVKGIPAFKFKF